MNGLAVLIPIALSLGLLGLAAFLWTMRSGQYDDLDGAAHRILIDEPDDLIAPPRKAPPQDEDGKPAGDA
jgi:cbb3-type cytochrome oxidase maturation protein